MNTLDHISSRILSACSTLYGISAESLPALDISLTTDAQKQQFGDICTNAALLIAKLHKKQPRAIAHELLAHLHDDAIAQCEIAGPGFINITLSEKGKDALAQEIFTQKETFFHTKVMQPKKYSLEYVSANPTGPLHIGHGRGAIIGDVLATVLRTTGNNVTQEFYINDAGAQIEKLGTSFKARCLQALGQDATVPEEGYQGEYLIELASHCIKEHGQALKDQSDTFFADYAKEHLLNAIKNTLKQYGVLFDVWFSEKSLHTRGAVTNALDILNRNGHLFTSEDGTLWFRSTTFGDDKDRVVRRSNGEFTYVASDIAYLLDKIDRQHEHMIMILGQDHHSYVTRLKAVLQGLNKNPNSLDVILYQLVTLKEDGEQLRMSKRKGRIVSLEDVIETVGRDVARFFYLNKKADAHLDFDLGLALKHSDENPVFYIQYAYVRTGSILEKAQNTHDLLALKASDITGFNADEMLLIKKIASLQNLLKSISHNYQVHLLTYYTLELTQLFHSYYAKYKVIDLTDVPQTKKRLALVTMIRTTLHTCLQILGISCPDKM